MGANHDRIALMNKPQHAAETQFEKFKEVARKLETNERPAKIRRASIVIKRHLAKKRDTKQDCSLSPSWSQSRARNQPSWCSLRCSRQLSFRLTLHKSSAIRLWCLCKASKMGRFVLPWCDLSSFGETNVRLDHGLFFWFNISATTAKFRAWRSIIAEFEIGNRRGLLALRRFLFSDSVLIKITPNESRRRKALVNLTVTEYSKISIESEA